MSELVTDIPGGSATWYTSKSLPPRRERLLQVNAVPMAGLWKRIQELGVEEANLTSEEVAAMFRLNEVGVVTFLKSWTLDQPLPETPDDVLDLDKELYDSLLQVAAVLQASTEVDPFSVDSVEDTSSPTGG